ncbi:MAG TPA: hypothetical protein V6C65_40210 [Allocoleopsis sp.]
MTRPDSDRTLAAVSPRQKAPLPGGLGTTWGNGASILGTQQRASASEVDR